MTTAAVSQKEIKYRACNLCEAICGLEIELTDGAITAIRGDKNDPLSKGHICPKGVALQDFQNDPDRLRKPIKRTADGWQEIDWDEALDLAVDGLLKVSAEHGPKAIASYTGNPAVHNYGCLTHAQHFLRPLGNKVRFSATSVDQLPHHLTSLWLYGHQLQIPIPDIDNTDFFLMLGANPMASNGSIMTVPNFPKRLRALQERGGKMIVIDPRRSETAEKADQHHFIRPGSDAALLAAMLKTLFDEKLIDTGHLSNSLEQFENIGPLLAPFTVEKAANITGIAANDILQLTRDFAAADKALIYGRMGVSTQRFGTLCQWLIQLLNIATGNLDKVGGMLCTTPAVPTASASAFGRGHFNRFQSRVSQLPEMSGEFPVVCLEEEISTPGDGQIKAMITIAGNPVLSTPAGSKLGKALEGLDFMVSVDPYMNETTCHANVILPPTAPLEHDHYDVTFLAFAVRDVARFNEAVIPKPEGALDDWEIFTELGKRVVARLQENGIEAKELPDMSPAQMMDFGMQAGPYGEKAGSDLKLSLNMLKDHPHGIDLGPLKPAMPASICHADKKIHCLPTEMATDLLRLDEELFNRTPGEGLKLIGRRHVRSNNSWMHNSHRLTKGKPRHQAIMHPDDLSARQLENGQIIKLTTAAGSVQVEVQSSDEVMPGVVSLPHGWGHSGSGGWQLANSQPGVSANDLTDPKWTDPVSGNAGLNGVAVEVSAA